MQIPLKMSIEEMEEKVYSTIEINEPLFEDDDEHRLMIDITRGALSIYHRVKDIQKETNVIISDFPLR